MKETWDEKQLVPFITGPYNQPKAGVENVRSMKYKVRSKATEVFSQLEFCLKGELYKTE
jgi:hypothetical protein